MRKKEEAFGKPTKEFLRKEIKEKRNRLSEREVQEKSKLIKETLFSLPEFKSAHTITFYVSKKEDREVDTEEMIKGSLKIGKRVLIPVVDTLEKKLVFSELKRYEDLVPSTFGILEPLPELRKILPASATRLVVVPGVVFDLHGHRIGQGAGYYDRFLESLSRYVIKIGLSFELQIVEELPKEDHDMKLDKIITEDRAIECK